MGMDVSLYPGRQLTAAPPRPEVFGGINCVVLAHPTEAGLYAIEDIAEGED
jgi:hypothetical protein